VNMNDWLSGTFKGIGDFANCHARAFAIAVSLIALPLSVLVLTPTALQSFTYPFDPGDMVASRPTTFIFLDMNGKPIGRRGPVAGQHLRLEEMPAYLPAAFIAMEDRRFYAHHGVDFLGLARAAYSDFRAHKVVAGGSTITQQTAKSLLTGRERTLRRKLRELLTTAQLENGLSKNQILEFYLNRIYLGDGANGVDTAARTYFGVSARRVTLAQAAMLAALTRAPSVFSPRRNLTVAQQRAARVLSAMVETGAVSAAEADKARAYPATIVARPHDSHGYFLDAAYNQARQLTEGRDTGSGELIVTTTEDAGLQQTAEQVAANAVQTSGRKLNFGQAAIVTMKPDGAVSALVGGVDYRQSVFDRVTQARRQPGSAFKPFVYMAALEAGISPWDWRDDQPVNIAGYQPANYKDASYGRLRLADALARSVNTITVNLAQEVGIPNVAAAARRAGITSPLQDNASLALGTNEVTPLELTAAYGFFANGGHVVTPFLVSRIVNAATGAVLYQHQPVAGQVAMADAARRDMIAMLYNVVTSGTGAGARLGAREAAGKTGTTQDYRDGWFVGFTTDYVTGVWVGNDGNAPMRGVTGGSMPARMWKDVMTVAEHGYPLQPLDRTPGPPPDLEASTDWPQGGYIDGSDMAGAQLPIDGNGNFVVLGSGVGPRRPHAMSDPYEPQPEQNFAANQPPAAQIAEARTTAPLVSVQKAEQPVAQMPYQTFLKHHPDAQAGSENVTLSPEANQNVDGYADPRAMPRP
jgi:penicillin-binding protein 1A